MIANLIYITSLMEGIVRLLYAETVHFFLLLLEAASRYTASHERRRGATTTGIWGEGGCWAVVKHVNNHTHCTKSAHTHTCTALLVQTRTFNANGKKLPSPEKLT